MTDTAVIDTRTAQTCLAAAAQRTAALIESLGTDRPVAGSEWTVGETAAHLIIALRGFTHSVTGDDREWRKWEDRIPDARTPERIETLNRSLIAAEPRRSAQEAARAINEGVAAFLAATTTLPPDQDVLTPWYGDGASLTVAEATCLLLGEQVVHGYDVARAAGRKWPISTTEALLIFEAAQRMMPKMADPITIGGASITYELRLGRATRLAVRIADGTAIIEPMAAGQRVDCHVLAEPVAMVLLAYGRISQWQAIGRARMITWGTKPWLAFRLATFFSHP